MASLRLPVATHVPDRDGSATPMTHRHGDLRVCATSRLRPLYARLRRSGRLTT